MSCMTTIFAKKVESNGDNYAGKTANSKGIAIVDDIPAIRDSYALILNHRGHNVVLTASSGEEIVSEARAHKLGDVDVAIMDYLMGPMTGLQAAAEVLRYYPRIKMIIASGEDEIEIPISISGLTYLRKPFTRSALLKCIE